MTTLTLRDICDLHGGLICLPLFGKNIARGRWRNYAGQSGWQLDGCSSPLFRNEMTAAGIISPAKVFVMGVGVAGLQAIPIARRLGAQVSATDVRSATREQIPSLGAKPIFVENVAGIEGERAGGYATEMSPEYQKAQAELVSSHIAEHDPPLGPFGFGCVPRRPVKERFE